MRGVTSLGRLMLGFTASQKLAHAYSNSLDDCAVFAALWSNSCGGTDEDAVYDPSTDWETTGAGVTTSNCSKVDKDVREPDTGNLVETYSVFARNCITCREDDNGEIRIRVQTNNMPKHCYGSSDDSNVTSYPETKKIDFEMLWNPDVLGYRNVPTSDVESVDATSSLLCDITWSASIPITSQLTDNDSVDLDDFVGLMMDNVLIHNALTGKSFDVH